MAQERLYTNSRAVANGLDSRSGIWKQMDQMTGDKGIGKRHADGARGMGTESEDL